MIGDVVWNTPGRTSADSLPLGNGDIAANVWTEPNGDIVFYLAKNDAWDHLGRLIKLGRLRLRLSPAPPTDGAFEQRLSLADASIIVTSGCATVKLWCDAHHPRLVIEITSAEPCIVHARLDPWRTAPRPLTGQEADSAQGIGKGPVTLTAAPDIIAPERPGQVTWYQRNTTSIWSDILDLQSLSEVRSAAADPLLNRTFGGCLQGAGFVNTGRDGLVTARPTQQAILTVTAHCAQTDRAETWIAQLHTKAGELAALPFADTWHDHCVWWRDFWARSFIHIEARGPDWGQAEKITQQAAWHRYLVACCGRGDYPVKFNGGLFTADWGLPGEDFDGDYRRWGGGYWWQNTRLIYWSLLANGDFELMRPLFRMYRDMLPLAEQRTATWFGHGGVFFPETLYFWGTHLPTNYGWDRDGKEPTDVENRYIRRYWQGGLELVAPMLATYQHSNDATLLRDELLPIARAVLKFYALHYPDEDQGKLHLTPAQSLETWWEAENPMPEIAGLHHLLPQLLALPAGALTEADRAAWSTLRARLPGLPRGERDGQPVLLVAEKQEDVPHNSENPELYAVFPYRLFGVGRPDLEAARRTFLHRMFPDTGGWRQDAIQAALLGLTETAAYYVIKNYVDGNTTPARFQGFWGPNYDWIPDFDHGSVGRLALQTMLVQTVGARIYLFPAWPDRRWNVSFRLHVAPHTVIDCELRDGRITKLDVTPPNRRADIVVLLGRDRPRAAEYPAGQDHGT